jgi:hypothetical protein
VLDILYLSYGEVRNISIPVAKRRITKELIIDDSKFEF